MNGSIEKTNEFIPDQKKLNRSFRKLQNDMPLDQFLQQNLNEEEDQELKKAVITAAEGFDAADTDRVSTLYLKEEWANGMEIPHVVKSYSNIIDFLVSECDEGSCSVQLKHEVKEIKWHDGNVTVKCSNGKIFRAEQVLVTVPPGVLLSDPEEKGGISFIPSIPGKINAFKKIGYGPVIKINFEFKTTFWHDKQFKEKSAQFQKLGFLSNESEFPMWWTDEPDEPFLTGWVGGSAAKALTDLDDRRLLKKAIDALALALFTSPAFLQEQLKAYRVNNWGSDPYSRGAYSYKTLDTDDAKKIIREPVAGLIFFAGEALGDHMGTVESAIESGQRVAEEMFEAIPEYI